MFAYAHGCGKLGREGDTRQDHGNPGPAGRRVNREIADGGWKLLLVRAPPRVAPGSGVTGRCVI
ncbi:MAG: hypothetical protein H6993_13815 [Pseudomonadales bacterium]|nr:hypothetical protein [Pseudomonadales bacterium]MCP5185037.1 hypothetical protein [Pseudomonadales bacterium]